MYDRSVEDLSLAQRRLEEFILKNQTFKKNDPFLKDNNPLPASWDKFIELKANWINTLYLLPASSIENIALTVRQIKEILEAAQHEIEDVLNKNPVKDNETRKKLINNYMFLAQKSLADALEKVDKSKNINLQKIYANQCLPPENRKSDKQIAFKIKYGAFETELKAKLGEELSTYKEMRRGEQESFKFNGFFSLFYNTENNFKKEDKLNAVTKLEERLKGTSIENFTDKELRALKDGRLGKIMEKYKKLGLPIENYKKDKEVAAAPALNN